MAADFRPETLLRAHIRRMEAYTPILPFEVLSQQLGLPIEQIVKLDANENPYGPLPQVQAALAEEPFLHIYPDPEARLLRTALSATTQVPVENLLAGAGADELIDLVLRLCLEPGERVLNCPPTFGMYAFDTEVNAGRVISVPRRADFSLDLETIAAAVAKEQPKLLFLASPNNPDGGLAPRQVIEQLLELPLIVVLDEAYLEFAGDDLSWLSEVTQRDNLVVLRTFSKFAGLAGLRVGYGAFPSWMMPHLWKIKQPYNVSVAASQAAILSLQHAGDLEARASLIIAQRLRLFQALQAIPWLQPYPSQANFILCRVLDRDAAQLKADLARRGILIRYFNKPGLQDHIRISIGTPAQIDRLLQTLGAM
ncbi:MAG: histidinol-phosphate transaminase [Anaerolineales bacterium]|nr:histidinol-phosphate transaminase [Anaerolineales bacterium]